MSTVSEEQPVQRAAPPLMGEPKELEPGHGTRPLTSIVGLAAIFGLFAWLWVGAGFRSFVLVVGLVVMIALHELGHYLTARWTGMKVTQFFLFFGPRVVSFHRKGVEYGVRLIPAGAFVRIVGMSNLDECAPEDEPYAYKNATYPRRMLVITAGSMMHFFQAILLFIVLSSVIGVNNTESWEIDTVSTLDTGVEAPSQIAGILPGDTIRQIDDQDTTDYTDLVDYVRANPNESVELVVQRGDETFNAETVLAENTLVSDGSTVGFLGVSPSYEKEKMSPLVGIESFGEAMWLSLGGLAQLPVTMVKSLPLLFQGGEDVAVTSAEASERPISLVGAVRIGGNPDVDWAFPISILAYINVFVGLFNLVPLLPLDGGHAAIATYERLRSRKGRRYQADVAKAVPIFYGTIAFLGVMFFSSLWLDIVRPIG